ncbi:MAG: hypothetical protein Tsb005_18170 [Gammaproteobacteria bacterium]
MLNNKLFEDLTKQISSLLPQSLQPLQEDFRRNVKELLESNYAKLGLVTYEEFATYQKVLNKTRAKLELLEQQINELKNNLPTDLPASNKHSDKK